jgi:cytochrome P450
MHQGLDEEPLLRRRRVVMAYADALLPRALELTPFEWYRMRRESTPIVFDPQAGCWQVFRYDDVLRVAKDHATFSSADRPWRRHVDAEGPEIQPSLIGMDPPRHRQFRNLVTQAFTPRAVGQLAPRIAAIAHELLDRALQMRALDVIDDLAYPLPVIVIAELLGVPAEDRPRFKRWSDAVIAGDPQVAGAAEAAVDEHRRKRDTARRAADEMRAYFQPILAARRQRPQHDLISDLLASEVGGQRLTEEELLGFCILLLVAGNITTTNLLGNAMVCFEEHPAALARLQQDPELVPSALEEVLRFRPPAKMLVRVAATDTTLADHLITQGHLVVAWIGSANRDAARFADPERFDVQREPNPHVTFGHGIHFCVGASLARLEGKIALQALLERLPELKRAPDIPLEPIDSVILSGVKHYPLAFPNA